MLTNAIIQKKIFTGVVSIILFAILLVLYRLINRTLLSLKIKKEIQNSTYILEFPYIIVGDRYFNPLGQIIFFSLVDLIVLWYAYVYVKHKHIVGILVFCSLSIMLLILLFILYKQFRTYKSMLKRNIAMNNLYSFNSEYLEYTIDGASATIYYNKIDNVFFKLDYFHIKYNNKIIQIPINFKKIYEYKLLADHIKEHQLK